MVLNLLPLILAGILSLADYITEIVFPKKVRRNLKLVSFSSGVAISYIVLSLFPQIASYAMVDGKGVFLYALLGFVSLNLIEQYVYKEIGRLRDTSAYHKAVHVAYFFVYNLFIGIVLVSFAYKGIAQALLFFIPFFLYIIVENLPQEFEFKNSALKALYFMAPLFGALIGINYISLAAPVYSKLTSFVTGTLLYIVIRESLPDDKAEKPLYFGSGVLFYTLVIFISWNLA